MIKLNGGCIINVSNIWAIQTTFDEEFGHFSLGISYPNKTLYFSYIDNESCLDDYYRIINYLSDLEKEI